MCVFDNKKLISNNCSSIISTEEVISYFIITQFMRKKINTENGCKNCSFSDKEGHHPHLICKTYIAIDDDAEELIFEDDVDILIDQYEYTHYIYEIQVYFCENCDHWYIDSKFIFSE